MLAEVSLLVLCPPPPMFFTSVDGSVDILPDEGMPQAIEVVGDRKSTRLNSSHQIISYAVFCLKKKKKAYWQCSAQSLSQVNRSNDAYDLSCTILTYPMH